MVAQVAPHRQIGHRRDAQRPKLVRGPDPRQHQKLRRVEHAAAQHHLACRLGIALSPCIDEMHAHRAPATQFDARRQRTRAQCQVPPLQRRFQIGIGGRRAATRADGELRAPETDLRLAVCVGCLTPTPRARRFAQGVVDRVLDPRGLRAQRAGATAPGVLAAFPGFAAFEIGQHVGIRPAGRALPRPTIEIAAMAAGINHHVDRGAAAQHLASPHRHAAVVQGWLRFGVVAPVEHAPLPQPAQPEWNLNVRVPIAAAGFQQQDRCALILGQAVGQHASRGSGADDDVVVSSDVVHGHVPSALPPSRGSSQSKWRTEEHRPFL